MPKTSLMPRTWLLAVALVVVTAACGGGESGSDNPALVPPSTAAPGSTTPSACLPPSDSLSVVAQNTAYDKPCLAVPANQPFTIAFDNRDAIAHDLVIVRAESSTDPPLFDPGNPFPGPKQMTYSVGPLTPGIYQYHCEAHPTIMKGVLVVS